MIDLQTLKIESPTNISISMKFKSATTAFFKNRLNNFYLRMLKL